MCSSQALYRVLQNFVLKSTTNKSKQTAEGEMEKQRFVWKIPRQYLNSLYTFIGWSLATHQTIFFKLKNDKYRLFIKYCEQIKVLYVFALNVISF